MDIRVEVKGRSAHGSAPERGDNAIHKMAKIDRWPFSTNGVSIMGREGIPCVGFGPGREDQAHAPNEIIWKADLVKCAAVYAATPLVYGE